MKIIKRGIPPQEKEWVGTCRNCGTTAKAKQSELHKIAHDQRDHYSFSWEKCPICGVGPYGGLLFYPKASLFSANYPNPNFKEGIPICSRHECPKFFSRVETGWGIVSKCIVWDTEKYGKEINFGLIEPCVCQPYVSILRKTDEKSS